MSENDKIFIELMLLHSAGLRRFALYLCRNDFDADDIVAETIAKAYESFSSLKETLKSKQWLFRILNNTFINYYRMRKKTAGISVSDDDDSFSLFDALASSTFTDNNPEKEYILRITTDQISEAINELPAEFRTALSLCDVEEFSYKEIADILKVPVGTVRSRISRARTILQKKLWSQAQEMGIKYKPKKDKNDPDYICTCGNEEEVLQQDQTYNEQNNKQNKSDRL
jgi:RNA polymerase sigma-70 factor, ECF subfamily